MFIALIFKSYIKQDNIKDCGHRAQKPFWTLYWVNDIWCHCNVILML